MLSNGHAGLPDEETQLPTDIMNYGDFETMIPEYMLGADMGDDGDKGDDEILAPLLSAWMNERSAPELLPFEFVLIQNTIEHIQNQTDYLETELSAGTVEMAFLRCLYQMEMERIKYILQSYFRTRLSKIERFCYYLRGLPIDVQIRKMTKGEIEHCKRYKELLEEALRNSVLDALPAQLRALPHQDPEWAEMVQQPDESSHVVARFTKDVPEVLIDPLMQSVESNVTEGDLYVLQYAAVKKLLAEGAVQLI